ncbi:AAA family ATPase [Hydrogenophaga sp. 2FB]|uniref:AAA family ATPase n=1 Tax=Hydrogenophaga sp. 2FB TaxID=2502187 RepID=UPI0010F5B991|nr:AAA family ATPase [Hydrogenophaga sp. 2FB]
MRKVKPTPAEIGLSELEALTENAGNVISQVRSFMLAPEARKKPPVFNSAQLCELCGIDRSRLQYLVKKGELPAGDREGNGRREWTLAEAREWVRALRSEYLRDPALATAAVITVANFKGGVSKTTTAAVLAQGLSLRGHKVLVVDCDPQGSLTTLFGVLPASEVEEEDTIMPLCTGEAESIMPSIQKTYWDGIDLVAAAPLLFSAEFMLPLKQVKDRSFAFWRVLDNGLDEARDEYDVIIIDTPPSLSYITINALMAANGVVMPLPPSSLDFASSAQFWNLFTETCTSLFDRNPDNKKFHFIDVVLSRVDRGDVASAAVREWIMSAYGPKVLPIEIPKTSIAASASATFGTVYDIDPASVQAKTLKRAHDAYEDLINFIEPQIEGFWADCAQIVKSTETELQAKEKEVGTTNE